MPTYEYRCPAGHEFEKFQKMSESQAELPCPVCGESAERRMSAGAGLVFKGSGFYITDYGKDGKKDQKARPSTTSSTDGGASSGDAGAAKPAESKPAASESKSESKPEAKPAGSTPPKSAE